MGAELGRISGPLLSANLLRNGVDLAFETNLLYFNVNTGRVGIKTDAPSRLLSINGTTNAPILTVVTQSDIANLTFVSNKIQNVIDNIYIRPNQATDPKITASKIGTLNLRVSNSLIENITNNSDINLTANGTGEVVFTTNKVNVNGNLHATGDITWDGTITFGTDSSDSVSFNSDITSSILPDVDNFYDLGTALKEWNNLYTVNVNADSLTASALVANQINLVLPTANTIYVSVNGNDTNIGNHQHATFKTLAHALSVAVSGDEVIIFPGTYTEIFPLTVPAGVTVRGASIRSVAIQPTVGTNDKDAFLLNGETTVEFLTVQNFFYNSTNNTGYAFRFAPGMKVTTRSPYMYNVTVRTFGSVTSLSDPMGFNQGDAGRGALLDGSVADATSREAAGLFYSATFLVPNADGITVTNGARCEWLNSFTYFANQGLYLTQGTLGFASLGVKFGAEMRSINSANVYGNYGAVADGASTLGYLIGHNFGYIGSGADSQNDYGLVDQAHEIVELNNGHLYYDSMDHKGDYRIGDVFYVNQQTGEVSFNAQAINFGSNGSIVFEGAGSGVSIDARVVEVNNIRIYDNTIDSTIGPVNLLAANTTTTLNTNVFVTGSFNVTGDAIVKGNIFLGDNPLDTVTVYPKLTQTIEPDITNTYTLGKGGVTPKLWKNAFLKLVNVDNTTQLTNNTISTLTSNTDLRLVAAGTGKIRVATTDVEITNDLTVDGTTSLKNTVIGIAALTTQVNQNVSGTSTPTGFFFYGWADDPGQTNPPFGVIQVGWSCVQIPGSVVTVVGDGVTNYDITITGGSFASGGFYSFTGPSPADITHIGDYLQTGNTNRTGNTDVTGHLTVLGANTVQLENVQIVGNKITTTVGNTDLTFQANGTGIVKALTNDVEITNNLDVLGTGNFASVTGVGTFTADEFSTGNISIIDNYITTTAPNWDLELQANGTGKILVPSNDVAISNSLTVDGVTTVNGYSTLLNTHITGLTTLVGNIGQTGSTDITGDIISVRNITGHDYLQASKINIATNIISATDTDADINFTANGTGGVVLDSKLKITNSIVSNVWTGATTNLQKSIVLTPNGTGNTVVDSNKSIVIPTGNNTNRVLSDLGEIRLNSTTLLFEGQSNGGVVSFKDIYDNDRNTYITAELTAGANDNTLRFVNNGVVKATITSTVLATSLVYIDDISLSGNTINNRISGNDLIFAPNGTGTVVVDSLPFGDNTIINATNSVLTIVSTGTGYVKFGGTGAVVMPIGPTEDRRLTPEVGEIRNNTTLDYMEVWNGTSWIPAVGTLGAAPLAEVLDIMDLWGLVLG